MIYCVSNKKFTAYIANGTWFFALNENTIGLDINVSVFQFRLKRIKIGTEYSGSYEILDRSVRNMTVYGLR